MRAHFCGNIFIKRFTKHIGIAVILNLLVKPVSLLLENKVQDEVGDAAWGMYAASAALCFLLGILADLGITAYSTQQYANQPETFRNRFSYFWGIKLTLSILFPLLIVGVGFLKNGIQPAHRIPLTFLFAISLLTSFTQIGEFLRSYIRGLQDFRTDSYLSVLEKVLYVIGVGLLLWVGVDIYAFAGMRIGVWILSCVIIFYFLSRLIGVKFPEYRVKEWGITLKYSIPFSLLLVLASVNDKIDQVLLQSIAGDKVAGMYAGAYRWIDAVFMFLWIVMPFFFARFSYLIHDYKAQQRLFNLGQLITAIPLLFISLFVFLHGEKLFFLFEKRSEADILQMTRVLKILFTGGAIYSVFSIFDNLMTATGFTRHVNKILGVCIVQNIVLNLIFIPLYGAEASAWATVSSYVTMALGYLFIMRRYMKIAIPWIQMLKLTLVFLATGLIYYSFTLVGLRWYVQTILAGIIYIIFLWVVKIIPPETIEVLRSLLNKKAKG